MSPQPSPVAGDVESPQQSHDRVSSATPGQQSKDEVKWRPIEAERLDDQRLEDLSIEVYGY